MQTNKLPLTALICFFLITTSKSQFALSAPITYWYSQTEQPGEHLLVCGSYLSGCTNIHLVTLAHADGSSVSSTETADIAPTWAKSNSMMFQIPTTFLKGAYSATLQSGDGSTTIGINRPSIWWVEDETGGEPTIGGQLRILGTNLFNSVVQPSVILYKGRSKFVITPSIVTPNSLTVTIPSTLKDGVYKVIVDAYSGVKPAESTLVLFNVTKRPHSSKTTVTVSPPTGSDDTALISNAIQSVSVTGGNVRLGQGTYLVHGTITIPANVSLIGLGPTKSILHWTDAVPPPDMLLGSHDFAISNLRIESAAFYRAISSPNNNGLMGHIHINTVEVIRKGNPASAIAIQLDNLPSNSPLANSGQCDSIHLSGYGIEVSKCTLEGSARPIYITQSQLISIHDNNMACEPGGWYSLSGCSQTLFERNNIYGLGSTGGAGGINTIGNVPASQNVYFANNIVSNFHNGNSEAMTTDGPGGKYFGSILQATSTSISLTAGLLNNGSPVVGCGVYILNGAAQGEIRTVSAVTNQIITLDAPLDVIPSAGDIVSIVPICRNYLVLNNTMSGTGRAVQFYGSSDNMIVEGNSFNNAGPVSNSGRVYLDGTQPSFYVDWINNKLHGRAVPYNKSQVELTGLSVFAVPDPVATPVSITSGVLIRDNELFDNNGIGLGIGPTSNIPEFSYVSNALVENNTVHNRFSNINIRTRTSNISKFGNKFVP